MPHIQFIGISEIPPLWYVSKNFNLLEKHFTLIFLRQLLDFSVNLAPDKKNKREFSQPIIQSNGDQSNGFILCKNCNIILIKIFPPQQASFITTHQLGDNRFFSSILQTLSNLHDFPLFDKLTKCDRYLQVQSRCQSTFIHFFDIADCFENISAWRSDNSKLILFFCRKCLNGPLGISGTWHTKCYIAINECTKISHNGYD